jgi:O-acetyl-ADP-ribose deacetylase (regulator of RNase III)
MNLRDYRDTIALQKTWERPHPYETREELGDAIDRVIGFLVDEEAQGRPRPSDSNHPRSLLRSLLNVRPPLGLPGRILNDLDRILWTERLKAGIIWPGDIVPVSQSLGCRGPRGDVLCLWQGDITRLGTGAIVNAANDALLGCFTPLHSCVDNCIHSAAGPRLRDDCARIMAIQREPEAPGKAKITRAYNLPAHFVLHTVGPIVWDGLTAQHREALASCYAACLDLAAGVGGIDTIAFCAISTGVYRFPRAQAAPIAVDTVTQWLDSNPGPFRKIILDVYSQDDHEHYRRLLSR